VRVPPEGYAFLEIRTNGLCIAIAIGPHLQKCIIVIVGDETP
jgi:hypothetical protein